MFFFTSYGWPGACALLTRLRDGTRVHSGKISRLCRQCDALANDLLGNLCPCIYVDVTLSCTTSPDIVAGQVDKFMATVFSKVRINQDNVARHSESLGMA